MHRRSLAMSWMVVFFFQAEDGIRDLTVTGVQTCALPISHVDADLSDQGLRHPPVHPRDGVQELDLWGERGDGLLHLLGEPVDDLVEVVELEIGRASCRERV